MINKINKEKWNTKDIHEYFKKFDRKYNNKFTLSSLSKKKIDKFKKKIKKNSNKNNYLIIFMLNKYNL